MIYGITYADEKMSQSAITCCNSMEAHGIDEAIFYQTGDIARSFRRSNREIFGSNRGCGFWLWKSYFIYRTMCEVVDGTIIIYSDAGQQFIGDIRLVIAAMDQDVMLFSNGWPHVEWCKADCINAIIPQHMIQLGSRREVNLLAKSLLQCQASFIIIRVSPESRNFIKEWLLWCQMPGLIDDSPSKLPNYSTFADHRHDQAILTCLQIKHGYKQHWFPSTTNMHKKADFPGDNYGAIIEHHRKRNPGCGEGVNPEW